MKKWKLKSSRKVFTSKWITIEKRSYELPNGKTVNDYFHLLRADYVLIIAKDKENRILLEQQYRRGIDQFVYELPAGFVEKGETPLNAAKRELREETGYEGEGKVIGEIYCQPGYSSQRAFVVLTDIQTNKPKKVEFEKDENIKIILVDKKEIDKMIKENLIKSMRSLAALTFYDKLKVSK